MQYRRGCCGSSWAYRSDPVNSASVLNSIAQALFYSHKNRVSTGGSEKMKTHGNRASLGWPGAPRRGLDPPIVLCSDLIDGKAATVPNARIMPGIFWVLQYARTQQC